MLVPNGKTINKYEWEQLVDDDDAFNEQFQHIFKTPDVPEAKNITPGTHDEYLNTEVALEKGGGHP